VAGENVVIEDNSAKWAKHGYSIIGKMHGHCTDRAESLKEFSARIKTRVGIPQVLGPIVRLTRNEFHTSAHFSASGQCQVLVSCLLIFQIFRG